MPAFTTPITAYDLTVGVKINMDDIIYVVSPMDSPLLGGIASDGLSVLSSFPVDEIQFFWMHESILTPRSALVNTQTTTDVFITVTAGDQAKFSTGDVIRVTKAALSATPEVMLVTGYGVTADTLTVTRAFAGTATSYSVGAEVIGLGTALAEGSAPANARAVDRVSFSNFTQIFGPTQLTFSATEQLVSKYGVSNELARQIFNRTQENVISREQAYLYGQSTNSTTSKIRTTGGIDGFITTVLDATSTQITVLTVQSNQQLNYNAGGLPDRLLANPASLADLNTTADTVRVRQTIDDPKRGRIPTMEIWTEFGVLPVVRNRWVNKLNAFGIKRDGVVRRTLRPLTLERMAKVGDSDQMFIVCEEGLEVKGQQHMFKMTNLTAY